ncbi:ribosomal RNA-processing protein 8 [Anastrepha obliqua]|uniref:ribosomal RNA-processing protein 8 n=1 Tax=Anastrepha obliqua TaxID=95512 RepID=UPI002409552C|nr:ribosomal RNA-processing protein 8 [Anastrepha obliqua]
MPKFFVPTSWENLAEAMKFRTKVSLGGGSGKVSAAQSVQTELNKKKGKQIDQASGNTTTDLKKGGLSKLKSMKSGTKSETAKNGRIFKKDPAKNQKTQAKVMIVPVPPLNISQQSISAIKMKANKLTKHKKVQVSASKDSIVSAASSLEPSNGGNVLGASASSEDIGLKVFENSLKHQLLGGRFRYINEQLYTMDSAEAEEFFKSDTEAFDAYHAGYQQQVEKWPLNPLDRIIKIIKRLPKALEIVDFGCGEGRLAESVPNKVYSMDLVSTRNDIIACDMAHTPLDDQSVDIAVYCLSLMGTNLKDYLLEANRVLRPNGHVIIAEIRSRFDDVREFIRGLQACGFELVKKDVNETLFYFFQFQKSRNVGKVALIPPFSLKPCLYRKR